MSPFAASEEGRGKKETEVAQSFRGPNLCHGEERRGADQEGTDKAATQSQGSEVLIVPGERIVCPLSWKKSAKTRKVKKLT